MEPCRFDMACWRPLCPSRHSGASREARWATQEGHQVVTWNLEVVKDSPVEPIPDRIGEQTIEFRESSGDTWSSGPGANDTTSTAAIAAVAKLVKFGLLGSHSAVPRRMSTCHVKPCWWQGTRPLHRTMRCPSSAGTASRRTRNDQTSLFQLVCGRGWLLGV